MNPILRLKLNILIFSKLGFDFLATHQFYPTILHLKSIHNFTSQFYLMNSHLSFVKQFYIIV